MVIYGYLAATQAIDLVELERGRMAQVSRGETPEPESTHEGFIYLALQELATRISHRNTGMQIGDPVGYDVMKRVCSDENLHQLFYRDLAAAAVEVDPNTMMIAMEKQVRQFSMPGTGIPNFDEHSRRIAKAGIYDLQIHHEQILAPVVLRQWDAANISGLTGEGALAQEKLMKRMASSERVAKRFAEKRAAAEASELQTA
jgi:acyl-[acyl-carrier-protein] desaturase